jgi:TatD DNase family protein
MIDSHCHLADEAFASDLEATLQRALAGGVSGALCIVDAADAAERARAAKLAAAWPVVRFAVGVHPHHASEYATRVGELDGLVRAALDALPQARAVGEIGLDFHYDYSPQDVQRQVCRAQARTAHALGLPVVVHARDAEDEVVVLLVEVGGHALRGVFHCFTGSAASMRRIVDAGFHVGFGGVLTFPRAHDVRDVARRVPLDRVLIETDSPYLAPVPHRGQRNEPGWVGHVAEALGAVHGVPAQVVIERTTANYEALFRP